MSLLRGVDRTQTAAAKGLIAGAAILYRRDGSHVNLAPSNDGTLVPDLVDVLSVQMSVVQWIIVIEKEVGEYRLPCPTKRKCGSLMGRLLSSQLLLRRTGKHYNGKA